MMALPGESSINLGLPASPIVQSPELAVELQRVYNAIRAVASAVDAYSGVLPESATYYSQLGVSKVSFGLNAKIYLEAGEALDYGNLIGIDGNGLCYKAEDGLLQTIGFCSAVDGVVLGEFAEIQLCGIYPEFPPATLTPGSTLYTTATPGVMGVKAAGPTWEQPVGFAISETRMFFNPQYVKL
jgi:hypothetical protein